MDLIINTFGTRIRSSGERVVLKFPGSNTKKEYPIRRLEKIIILRPSSISTNAVQLALEHDIDIVYLGSFGKPVGRIFPSSPRGLTLLRRAQLEAANSPRAFDLAKSLVRGKCLNQITYLEQLAVEYGKSFEKELIQSETLVKSVDLVPHTNKGRGQLFGIEGYVADRYFTGLKRLYRFARRNPQGRDRFNSALNYGYGILYSEIERVCLYVGLDPYLGFYHSERYGKPSLVLDLIEEFRVPIVDSAVLPLFLNKRIKSGDFEKIGPGSFRLSAEGKHKIVDAVFKRFHQTVKWQGKRQKVRSVIEFQIRALAHYLLGKKKEYIPFDFHAVSQTHE